MKKISLFFSICLLAYLASCSKDETTTSAAVDCTTINAKFTTNVAPILASKCGGSSCHPTNGAMFAYNDVKGHVDAGHFKTRVIDNKTMPPAGSTQLNQTELDLVSCWLSDGAQDN